MSNKIYLVLENGDVFRDAVDGAQKFRFDLVERGVEFGRRNRRLAPRLLEPRVSISHSV